jgi:hypothetical protein
VIHSNHISCHWKLEKARQRRGSIVTNANGAPHDVIEVAKEFFTSRCHTVSWYTHIMGCIFVGVSCIEFCHNLIRNVVIVAKFYLHPPASVAFVAPGSVKLSIAQRHCVKITGADAQNQSRNMEKCRWKFRYTSA